MTPEQYAKLAHELGEGSWKKAAMILAENLWLERNDGFHRAKNQTVMPIKVDKPGELP